MLPGKPNGKTPHRLTSFSPGLAFHWSRQVVFLGSCHLDRAHLAFLQRNIFVSPKPLLFPPLWPSKTREFTNALKSTPPSLKSACGNCARRGRRWNTSEKGHVDRIRSDGP